MPTNETSAYLNPFTNQDLSSDEEEEQNERIWLRQIIEMRNRLDLQSFEDF